MLLFAFTGFPGFEATALFGEEARDPHHTIPRATYAAILLIGAIYVLTTYARLGRDFVGEGGVSGDHADLDVTGGVHGVHLDGMEGRPATGS